MNQKRRGANGEVKEKNSALVITLFELWIKLHLKFKADYPWTSTMLCQCELGFLLLAKKKN